VAAKLKAELAKAPELLVIVTADDQTSHGAIVDVMDEMRQAGVSRLAIAVNPERRTQP
jgi:biopolymer transport protein ExbD